MQHSSVGKKNLEISTNINNTVANTPEFSQIQSLSADLWLERCLNQLQQQINDYLLSANITQKNAGSIADIFHIVVKELSTNLENCPIALALIDTLASVPTYSIADVAPTQVSQQIEPSMNVVVLATEQTIYLNLAQIINLEDLQYLENQQPQSAWSLKDDKGVVGWLIAATSLPQSNLEFLEILKIERRPQLIERAITAGMLAVTHSRRLKSLSRKCQQLESDNQELLRNNQLKSEFLANTSHEIRTPLSSILGFTRLLQAQGYNASNSRHQEYLNIIFTSGQHLLALLNDILDLSKIEANQLEVHKESVDVPELCRSVIAMVKEKASNKALQLRLHLDFDVTTLIADPLRLKQMLFNLLSNALKFTSQGTVGLQVKPKGLFLHFTVWDTGTGISLEEQAQLFQPYSQIANVVAGRQEGTGLGLALTQKLAELHDGWVEVQSEVNRGSKFTIVLPLTPAVGIKEGLEARELRIENGETVLASPVIELEEFCLTPKKVAPILLVEDNLPNAKLMTTYLKKLGYQVDWVINAAQMWQALQQSQPTLILMDIHLPDVDGLTLVKQLKADEHYKTIPVITQTAMAMKGDRETCLEAGASDYISKPIDLQMLALLVAKYTAVPSMS